MRLRLILLVALSQAVMIGWVTDSEIIRSVYLICYSLMMPTVVFLLAARGMQARGWLTRQETLLGYIALTASIPIIGFGGLRFLMPGMGFLRYFSETQPEWRPWLGSIVDLPLLHNTSAVEALYRGGSGVPWHAWILPILFWSGYLLLLTAAWTGFGIALNRAWIREERLSFPVAALPIQLTSPTERLGDHRLLWLGAGIPIVLQSLLALHEWYPGVPAVQLKASDYAATLFTSPPWNSIRSLPIGFYPMAIGLAYLVPSPVSFSCWVFWILARVPYLLGAFVGIEAAGTGSARFPFPEEQAAGAWIALAAIITAGAVVRLRKPETRASRPVERRAVAVAGVCLFAAFVMIVGTGVRPVAAGIVVAAYAAYVVAGARVRAEAGGQWTFSPATMTPARVAWAATGTESLGDRGLASLAHFDLVHVDIRGQSLPYLIEGLKIADDAGLRLRTVILSVGAATITAIGLGWWSGLTAFHEVGAATVKSNAYALWKVRYSMQQMDSAAANPSGPDGPGLMAMAVGALITVGLAALRTRVMGFPLHPVGYVLSNTYTMNSFFAPFLLAWLTKVFIQRFGGARAYRRSVGFFLGLTLGDILIQAFWTIVGRLLNAPVYQFLS